MGTNTQASIMVVSRIPMLFTDGLHELIMMPIALIPTMKNDRI